jgi:hypothetical protein
MSSGMATPGCSLCACSDNPSFLVHDRDLVLPDACAHRVDQLVEMAMNCWTVMEDLRSSVERFVGAALVSVDGRRK